MICIRLKCSGISSMVRTRVSRALENITFNNISHVVRVRQVYDFVGPKTLDRSAWFICSIEIIINKILKPSAKGCEWASLAFQWASLEFSAKPLYFIVVFYVCSSHSLINWILLAFRLLWWYLTCLWINFWRAKTSHTHTHTWAKNRRTKSKSIFPHALLRRETDTKKNHPTRGHTLNEQWLLIFTAHYLFYNNSKHHNSTVFSSSFFCVLCVCLR